MNDQLLVKHLFTAFYRWCAEVGNTPHLIVDATLSYALHLPSAHQHDALVLNISMNAVTVLDIDDQGVYLEMAFAGKPTAIQIPWHAVKFITSKETQHMLANQTYGHQPDTIEVPNEEPQFQPTKPRPKLTLVKG